MERRTVHLSSYQGAQTIGPRNFNHLANPFPDLSRGTFALSITLRSGVVPPLRPSPALRRRGPGSG